MERYVDLDDGKIFVSTYGIEENFPLVLLHGNSEDSSYFIHQIEYFSDKYFVIAIDSRAHGKSSYTEGEKLTIDKLADDVINTLAVMEVEKANFLGFSDGGNVAISVALKKPELINRLVLNGANLNPSGVKLGVNLKIYLTYAHYSFMSLFKREYKRKKAVWKLMINEPNFTYEQMQSITAKTLVIVGEDDMIKFSHSKKMSEGKNVTLTVMEGNHFIAVENPLEFNKEVEEFFEEKASK